MVMQVGGALSTQMRTAGARSEIVVLANASLDSIEATPLDSLTMGTALDSVVAQGWTFQRTVTITSLTAILARVDVTISPAGGSGPSHAVTSYTSAVW